MQVRFDTARWIGAIIAVVGTIGLILAFIQGPSGSVLGFIPEQVWWLSALWAVVGTLLLWLGFRSADDEVDSGAVNRLENQVRSHDMRFKDLDARLDARVGDVDNRFNRRVGDFDGKLGALDTRVKSLESAGTAAPRMMGFSGATEVIETPDDLKLIEGIGPKMEAALFAVGINTYAKLAKASDADLRAAVDKAGMSFAPSIATWARQAKYLVDGDRAGFDAYVAKLTAGRQ